MQKKFWIGLTLLVVIPGLFFTASCAKKTVQSEAAVSELPKTEAAAKTETSADKLEADARARAAELERQRKLEEERLKAQQAEERRQAELAKQQAELAKQQEAAAKALFLSELVLFDFDKSTLTPTAQDRLKRKAKWLQDNPKAKAIIEGHCDERGSNAYNLALGWRRAEAAKAFLVDLGVAANRLSTISYGKERPFAKGHDESAWSQNRRAHFVLE